MSDAVLLQESTKEPILLTQDPVLLYEQQVEERRKSLAKQQEMVEKEFGERRKDLKRKRQDFDDHQKKEREHFMMGHDEEQANLQAEERLFAHKYPVVEYCDCDEFEQLLYVIQRKLLYFPQDYSFIEWLQWSPSDELKEEQESKEKEDLEHLAKHGISREWLKQHIKCESTECEFYLTGHMDGYKGEDTHFAADDECPMECPTHPDAEPFETIHATNEWNRFFDYHGEIEWPEDHDSYWAKMTVKRNTLEKKYFLYMHKTKKRKELKHDSDSSDCDEIEQVYRKGYEDIFFFAPVKEKTCRKLQELLFEIKSGIRLKFPSMNLSLFTVTIHISSSGGDPNEAFAIYDLLQKSEYQTVASIEGRCISAASIIALGCKKRVMTANSVFLIHQITARFEGTDAYLHDESMNQKLDMEMMCNIYRTQTKLSTAKLNFYLKRDLNISAQDCLKYGFVHEICC